MAQRDVGYVPATGTCIRNPDGSHEWVIPNDPERYASNLAILVETARRLDNPED